MTPSASQSFYLDRRGGSNSNTSLVISEMNKLSALDIKLVDNFFDKEASNFLKDFIPAIQGVDGLFFSSFIFKKKELRNGWQDGTTKNKAPGF